MVGQNEHGTGSLFVEAVVAKAAGRVGDLLGQLDVDGVLAAAIELSQAAEESYAVGARGG
jgi:hypothetical protein